MGTHPIFESDFDCLTEMSEIVFAAGEGPTTPRVKGDLEPPKRTGVSRAKVWSEEAEENYRFQEAGFLDRREYETLFPTHQIARWESGRIKKLQRKDGNWNYFKKDRELVKNYQMVKLLNMTKHKLLSTFTQ